MANNIVNDLVEVMQVKAADGVKKLKALNIDDDEFKTVMENTLTCVSVIQKMVYEAQQSKQKTKPDIKV